MKTHIWADPKKEWEGFRFTAYWLDWKKIATLPVTQQRITDGKREEISMTLGDVFKKLADQKFDVESGLGITIKTGTEELTFGQPSFSAHLLAELVKLRKEGISPSESLWFWYDNDSCRDDPHKRYSFFVVHEDRIVRESVSFSDYHESGFDPDIFTSHDQSDAIWSNEKAWDGANARYWYRKFYTETRIGQLMLLRDDEPKLYDYQRHPGPDMAVLLSQKMLNSLTKIHALLWVLIVLGGLILMRLWRT